MSGLPVEGIFRTDLLAQKVSKGETRGGKENDTNSRGFVKVRLKLISRDSGKRWELGEEREGHSRGQGDRESVKPEIDHKESG